MGGQVKDIDIFIDANRYPTDERKEALADRIFDAFEQTWERTDSGATGGEGEGYGDDQAGDPFQTYGCLSTEGEWNKVNLIFSTGNERVSMFDWSICRFFVDRDDGAIYNHGVNDDNLNHIRYVGPMGSAEYIQGAIRHAQRIRAKYPQSRFEVSPQILLNAANLYTGLLQGGLIGENAREVLPTQAQIPTGDQVRFNSRAGAGQETNWPHIPTPRTSRTEAWTRQAAQALNWNVPQPQFMDWEDTAVPPAVRRPNPDIQARIEEEARRLRLRTELLRAGVPFTVNSAETGPLFDRNGNLVPDGWVYDPGTREGTPF